MPVHKQLSAGKRMPKAPTSRLAALRASGLMSSIDARRAVSMQNDSTSRKSSSRRTISRPGPEPASQEFSEEYTQAKQTAIDDTKQLHIHPTVNNGLQALKSIKSFFAVSQPLQKGFSQSLSTSPPSQHVTPQIEPHVTSEIEECTLSESEMAALRERIAKLKYPLPAEPVASDRNSNAPVTGSRNILNLLLQEALNSLQCFCPAENNSESESYTSEEKIKSAAEITQEAKAALKEKMERRLSYLSEKARSFVDKGNKDIPFNETLNMMTVIATAEINTTNNKDYASKIKKGKIAEKKSTVPATKLKSPQELEKELERALDQETQYAENRKLRAKFAGHGRFLN